MIQETIGNIRSRIEQSGSITDARKAELLELVSKLESEVNQLSATDADQARSIAGFAEVSAHEATRSSRNPQLLKLSLEGFQSSVTELEKSHPRLVTVVNAISRTLSNLGI